MDKILRIFKKRTKFDVFEKTDRLENRREENNPMGNTAKNKQSINQTGTPKFQNFERRFKKIFNQSVILSGGTSSPDPTKSELHAV